MMNISRVNNNASPLQQILMRNVKQQTTACSYHRKVLPFRIVKNSAKNYYRYTVHHRINTLEYYKLTILNSNQQCSYRTCGMLMDTHRKDLVEKEESTVLETFSNINNHIDTLEKQLIFDSVEERDTYFETLFSYLESVAKGIEKLTWLQGTKTFSSDEEVEFISPFDDPFSESEIKPKEEKRSKLDILVERVLDVLHKYGTKPESTQKQNEYAMTLPTIGLEMYSMMKRFSMEFERCSANEITPFLENECFFDLNQNNMNYLLRYFADTKDKTNTLIILKDMQQMQLGANVFTYNTLIRYALQGEDKGQAVKLAKYMKQQGLEIDPETKDMLRQHRLM